MIFYFSGTGNSGFCGAYLCLENTKTGGTVDPEIGFSVRSEGIFCNDLW